MKKKIFCVILAIALIFAMLYFMFFEVLRGEIFVEPSPNGDYQIVSWWIDKGGFGYGGAFYIKEKGLFSKWHKLGTVPYASKWLSETEFSIYCTYPIDEDNYKEYNVNDFFTK